MKKKLVFILFTLSLSLSNCYYDNEEELYPTTTNPATCDLTTAKFATFVSPLISSKCATSGCHNATSRAAGINLSSYNTIKAYITSSNSIFLGSIKHSSGFSPMPQGGTKLAACDISKIESWIAKGMLND
jgi:hypothetical protein